jgi:eukaryotic-like serine/threonine-protein kinase
VALGAGECVVPDAPALIGSVPYIIFELADGDVRARMAKQPSTFDDAFKLRVLHGSANGLRQLHEAGVAHQDLKPSNTMTSGRTAKIGDLGRASRNDVVGHWDGDVIPGDRTYAPPEQLYRFFHGDPQIRRRASDLYQLGSLIVFMFHGVGITGLLNKRLDPAFHWRTWPRDYENVLIYVRAEYNKILEDLRSDWPEPEALKLEALVRKLCDPDPQLRGEPNLRSRPDAFSLERTVSALDLLARSVEMRAFKK